MCRCARGTVAGNELYGRVDVVQADLREAKGLFRAGGTDTVVANPPYFRADEGRISPNRCEALARHELECTLGDVLAAARYLLPPGGRYLTVYPAARLADLIASLPAAKLRPARVVMVHPRRDRNASHVLLEAVKSGGQGLKVLPPVVTHAADGGYGKWYEQLSELVAG